MEQVNEKVVQKEEKFGHSRGISSSCDDLLEERLASDTNEPIGLITQAETQRPLRSKETDQNSPVKGSSGKKNRRRKISMPWFRQSSFGIGLSKIRLPKQHTIASGILESPTSPPYHPEGEGTSCRAVSSSELLRQKVRRNVLFCSQCRM